MSKYAKFIVAAALAFLYTVQAGLSDQTMTNTEWVAAATQAVAALAVYLVPNRDPNTDNTVNYDR